MSRVQRLPSLAAHSLNVIEQLSIGWLPSQRLASPQVSQIHQTQAKFIHWTAAILASIQVKVPALGESITDGTVSAVLKNPGDAVEEDEPLVQIETDKVTVDVRSPCAGVVEAILVKPDENIAVGHVIASIEQGAAAARAEGTAPPIDTSTSASMPQTPLQHQPSPPAATSVYSNNNSLKYEPKIAFPPRRTNNGELISALPKAEALQAIQAAKASSATLVSSASSAASIQFMQQQQRQYQQRNKASPPPPRREMSEAEIEAIMLGGIM